MELETNVIVEEGDRKGPFIDPGHDVFDDNAINAAGEPEFTQRRGIRDPKK